MNRSGTLLAIVATFVLARGVLAADAIPPIGQNAPATQPGLPDPSGTARMSDVGDGTTPGAAPTPPIATPASVGKPDGAPDTTDGRSSTPGATR